MNPRARRDGLVTQELGEETVVYDRGRSRAHRLNRTAALVWKHADGRTPVSEIAAKLQAETGLALDERMVEHALSGLAKARLLEDAAGVQSASRRAFMRGLGLTGALAAAVPVVQSVLMPHASEAQAGCLKGGSKCSYNSQCCSGLCVQVNKNNKACIGG